MTPTDRTESSLSDLLAIAESLDGVTDPKSSDSLYWSKADDPNDFMNKIYSMATETMQFPELAQVPLESEQVGWLIPPLDLVPFYSGYRSSIIDGLFHNFDPARPSLAGLVTPDFLLRAIPNYSGKQPAVSIVLKDVTATLNEASSTRNRKVRLSPPVPNRRLKSTSPDMSIPVQKKLIRKWRSPIQLCPHVSRRALRDGLPAGCHCTKCQSHLLSMAQAPICDVCKFRVDTPGN